MKTCLPKGIMMHTKRSGLCNSLGFCVAQAPHLRNKSVEKSNMHH